MDPITQQQLLGAASGAAEEVVIDDVFSTTLYEGTGSAQTITNGIDLSGAGGLVWIKTRSHVDSHSLTDTERGATYYIKSDTADNMYQANSAVSAFNSDGFDLGGADALTNGNGRTYVSWTFRKARNFFDVVTWTGDGVNGRQISHSLGSTPGMIIIKRTSAGSENWVVYHRSIGTSGDLTLNSNVASGSTSYVTAVSSSTFSVSNQFQTNGSTETYVAYIFGHDDLIQCGSYTGNGQTNSINVGFEAQFVIVKRTDGSGQWVMHDSARSAPKELDANNDTSETDSFGFSFSSTGFTLTDSSNDFNGNGDEYIYIAIKAPNPIDYSVGTYYPMFAVKAIDVSSSAVPSVDSEVPMRRALSFDTNNTSQLYGNESVSDMIDILDTHKYTCNPDFGASGNKISGIMIRHYQSTGSLYTGGQASFEFASTNFNIYDDACNATALAAPTSGTMNNVIRACGAISNVQLSGHSGTAYAWVNQSTSSQASPSGAGWSSDDGDYCFLGVGTYDPPGSNSVDNFDTTFSSGDNTVPGLAFGISDSDGRGTGSETTPREGIARRSTYVSLLTNCLVEKSGAETAHGGHTNEGYFIVYGKYLSA